MRSRIFAGALLMVGMFGAALVAHNGATKHSSIINFLDPVLVKSELVMGPVLIFHDDLKMAKGEACTTFYRFDRGQRQLEKLGTAPDLLETPR